MLSNPCISFLILVINFIFALFAFAFVIVGIHIIMDHGLMLEISSGSIYLTGMYLLIFCGFLMMITICIGLYGSIREDRFMLMAFIVLLIILFILHFIGGILLLAYTSSVNEDTKTAMRNTLRDQYGKTKLYTDAWNLTQNKLRCCGVDDLGWSIYRDSYWDNVTNMNLNNKDLKIPISNPFYKMVPMSCCWTLIDTQTGWPSPIFRDVDRCQYYQFGPPNQNSGGNNDAVNYRGCANAMKSFLGMYSRGLGGLAIFFIFVIIVGIIVAIVRLRYIGKKGRDEPPYGSDFKRKDNNNAAGTNNFDDYPPDNEHKMTFLPDESREFEREDSSI